MALSKRDILNKTKVEFYNEIKKYQRELKPTKEIEGYGSTALVGEKNYPQLKVYNVSNQQKSSSFFNTNDIVKKNYSDIVKLKARNIMGNTNNIYVKRTNTKVLGDIQDIYKARNAVEFTSNFDKELKFNKPVINKLSGVLGTKNELLNVDLNENAKTSRRIEKYTQNDIKSKEAIINLYKKGTNESQIINLLALGNFGMELNKKIVPSRWAITAYDKTIENYLFRKILSYRPIQDYEVYFNKDKGNTFLIILIPDSYSVESIEFMRNNWSASDYVSSDNRLKKTEPDTAGGFYATKLAINEYLDRRKRQARYICIRLIEDYDIPLGVVFVRECVRGAMNKRLLRTSDFRDLDLFLKENYPHFYPYYAKSHTLKESARQRKLRDFF